MVYKEIACDVDNFTATAPKLRQFLQNLCQLVFFASVFIGFHLPLLAMSLMGKARSYQIL
jgi:hypothetical protein